MNTRDFKLYILKTLGVASLMALGAVFLVLAATFTSSKKQRIRNGYWEYVIDVDKYFPSYNKWLWKMSEYSNRNSNMILYRYPRSSHERSYKIWKDQTIRLSIVAAEASPNLHSSVLHQARQKYDSLCMYPEFLNNLEFKDYY